MSWTIARLLGTTQLLNCRFHEHMKARKTADRIARQSEYKGSPRICVSRAKPDRLARFDFDFVKDLFDTQLRENGWNEIFDASRYAAAQQQDVAFQPAADCICNLGSVICRDAKRNGDRPGGCLLYTSPSPRDLSTSRMPSSA